MEIREHEIFEYISQKGNKTKLSDVCRSLGKDREAKTDIKRRIDTMARFGIVKIEGNTVTLK